MNEKQPAEEFATKPPTAFEAISRMLAHYTGRFKPEDEDLSLLEERANDGMALLVSLGILRFTPHVSIGPALEMAAEDEARIGVILKMRFLLAPAKDATPFASLAKAAEWALRGHELP